MPTLDNPRWEQFAQFIVAGRDQKEAYSLVFGSSDRTCEVNSSDLIRKQPVSDRISELRRSVSNMLPVLSLAEKREFLRSVVKTEVGKIDENSPLTQSYKRRVSTDKNGQSTEEIEFKMPDKLRAIELDAKLAGELVEGHNRDAGMVINIAMIGSPFESQ